MVLYTGSPVIEKLPLGQHTVVLAGIGHMRLTDVVFSLPRYVVESKEPYALELCKKYIQQI